VATLSGPAAPLWLLRKAFASLPQYQRLRSAYAQQRLRMLDQWPTLPVRRCSNPAVTMHGCRCCVPICWGYLAEQMPGTAVDETLMRWTLSAQTALNRRHSRPATLTELGISAPVLFNCAPTSNAPTLAGRDHG
jgi:hypothetical protein